jgi:hypothetical protein
MAEWMAYFKVEPWGCEAQDVRLALLRSDIRNGLRGKGEPDHPRDLVPGWTGPREQSAEEQMAAMKAMAAAWGAG